MLVILRELEPAPVLKLQASGDKTMYCRNRKILMPLFFALIAIDFSCIHHSVEQYGKSIGASDLSQLRREAEQNFLSVLKEKDFSIFISVQGATILDKPFADGKGSQTDLMSVTKSVAALAVGLAVDRGLIHSIDEPIEVQFPGFLPKDKKSLTLRHLLTMTAGLTEVGQTNEQEVYEARDTVALAKSCKPIAPPGTRWDYDNRSLALIAEVVRRATHLQIQDFTQQHLFSPLGIQTWSWEHDDAGYPYLMAGLSLSASDLAKIGQVVANRGCWQAKTLLSAAWIDALGQTTPTLSENGYGLLWWVGLPGQFGSRERCDFDNILWGQGYADQYVFVDLTSKTVIAILHRPPEGEELSSSERITFDEVRRAVIQVMSTSRTIQSHSVHFGQY